jgi:hypothetical protein
MRALERLSPYLSMCRRRRQIFVRRREKYGDARPISGKNTSRFYTGSGPSESTNHTSSVTLLIYDFSLLILIASMEFRLLLS